MAKHRHKKQTGTANQRKVISKKERFEILNRDNFTCQYCGQKAPDVVLHVDHIKPVAKGGTNEHSNLITSCSSCNGGKSDTELGNKISFSAEKRREILHGYEYTCSCCEFSGNEDELIVFNTLLGNCELFPETKHYHVAVLCHNCFNYVDTATVAISHSVASLTANIIKYYERELLSDLFTILEDMQSCGNNSSDKIIPLLMRTAESMREMYELGTDDSSCGGEE